LGECNGFPKPPGLPLSGKLSTLRASCPESAPARSPPTYYDGQHRFEHWHCDNSVYFITARVRDKIRAFASEDAIHGSIAKRVNDLLPERIKPFWYDSGKQGYFDGCLRESFQGRHTFRYVLLQAVRNGIVLDYHDYPHTRVNVEMEIAIERAIEVRAFMEGVEYKRYARSRRAR
jgi:hypothetical protein